ncbi:protein kinase [Streptomyces sp. NPDC060031]|uniref:protein kinase domain-containing protein n=1 Tax=Streptomyces sp. NPDC060031 TaxID=3347043 RepID=UPI0036C4AAA1
MSGGFAVRVGDQLAGRYRLDQRLGQGGMGEVWRAHDTALDRAVAVKVLLEAATNEELVARFRREATIGARLQHPGITVVHDVGQQDGRLFIVMELLAGEDLASVLARAGGGLPADVAVGLAAQTAEALAAAHEQAVIHRDLKPANLFLLPGGRLKICDFGIAHSSDATAGWTVTGRIFGSPPYMAPEQWRGERVDARCDLYALGCVLYALLSGDPPYGQAEGPYVLMLRHIEEVPLPLREVGAPVAPELERLVRALLAKDPADRPESALAVAKTLRGLTAPGDGAGAGAGDRSGEPVGRAVTGGSVTAPPATGGSASATASGAEVPAGVGAAAGSGDGHRDEAGDGDGTVAGGVTAVARGVVGGLLREVEETLRALPADAEARVEVLAVAADAAARYDAGLAGRLLADAEVCAWTAAQGDGARAARLLTALARDTAGHCPARARRLLTDAQQALFTVFGPDRRGPLLAVAEELAGVAPEHAAQIAGYHFADGPVGSRLRARIDMAVAVADPWKAERQLSGIEDAGRRATATYDMVLALAARDLPAALRLSERIGSAGARLLALCQVTRDRTAAGDMAGAAQALAQAEQELPGVLEERASWLREEAARHAGRGRLVESERLLTRASGLLRGRLEAAGDEKADHALASVAAARAGVEQGSRPPLDPARALERAERARSLPEAAERAGALARIALECAATGSSPWLPEAAADPGSPPPLGTAVAVSAGSRVRRPPWVTGEPGAHAWHTDARPDALYAAGDGVVWRSGAEVGCVRADVGATRWTAIADEGTSAPLPGRPAEVSCTADAGTVCVAVRRDGEPALRLVAREPQDGRVRWWRDLPEARLLRAAGDMVLHGGTERLTALSAATGETLWTHEAPHVPGRSLTVGGECVIVVDGPLRRGLRLSDGEPLWSWWRGKGFAPEDAWQPGAPVYVLDGDTVRALHQSTGRELWHVELGSPAARVLAWHDTVYVAAYRPAAGWDVVYALDAATGAERWRQPLIRRDATACAVELLGVRPGGLYVRATRPGRRSFLGAAPPYVAVLDPATGKRRWRSYDAAFGEGDAVLIGEHVIFPGPELTAVTVP